MIGFFAGVAVEFVADVSGLEKPAALSTRIAAAALFALGLLYFVKGSYYIVHERRRL
jgi:hypothetical protein